MLYREFAIYWGGAGSRTLHKVYFALYCSFQASEKPSKFTVDVCMYRSHCCVQVVNDHVITVSA